MVSGCRVHSKPELTRKVTDRSASNTKNMLQGPAMTWGSDSPPTTKGPFATVVNAPGVLTMKGPCSPGVAALG